MKISAVRGMRLSTICSVALVGTEVPFSYGLNDFISKSGGFLIPLAT
jgi:hypothetical protein